MATRQAGNGGRRVRRGPWWFLDPMGSSTANGDELTSTDEFDMLRAAFEARHGIRLDAVLRDVFDPIGDDAFGRCDLVIFDWGGMSLGNDLMGHQLRALLPWAEDHPSVLVVIRR